MFGIGLPPPAIMLYVYAAGRKSLASAHRLSPVLIYKITFKTYSSAGRRPAVDSCWFISLRRWPGNVKYFTSKAFHVSEISLYTLIRCGGTLFGTAKICNLDGIFHLFFCLFSGVLNLFWPQLSLYLNYVCNTIL